MLFTREQQSHLPHKTTIKTMSDLSDKPQLRKKTEQEQEQEQSFAQRTMWFLLMRDNNNKAWKKKAQRSLIIYRED
jgi:hypothetical protein